MRELQFVRTGDPLTYDFDTEFRRDELSGEFRRSRLPYRFFQDQSQVVPYLKQVEKMCKGFVGPSGSKAPVWMDVAIPEQFEIASHVLDQLASFSRHPDFRGVVINRIGV